MPQTRDNVEERSTYRAVEGADPELLRQHPADVFGRLLAEAPVHKGEGRMFGELEFPALWPDFKGETYLVLSYDGALEAFRSEHVSSDIHQQGFELVVGRSLFGMDPPEQTDMRRLLMAGFTPAQIRRWEDVAIRPAVCETLEAAAARGRFDFVRDVAEIYPYRIMAKILGVPDDVGEWAGDRVTELSRVESDPAAAVRASQELGEYFTTYVEEKRAKPEDDFISVLVHAEIEDGQRLNTTELVDFLRHLMLAGIETTFRASGTLMRHLLLRRELWEAIVADRSLIPGAIEEGLRLDPPANYFPRKTTAPIEVEGVTIPADTVVYVAISAANRDPGRWPDPDRFDLHRPLKPHLSFGSGPHTCIGMHLARRELSILLNELADRLPGIRLDPTEPEPIAEGWMQRGVRRMPVVGG